MSDKAETAITELAPKVPTIGDVFAAKDATITALRAEVERLRAALEWYAEHDNYRLLDFSNDMSAVDLDSGTRARAALNAQEKT